VLSPSCSWTDNGGENGNPPTDIGCSPGTLSNKTMSDWSNAGGSGKEYSWTCSLGSASVACSAAWQTVHGGVHTQ
jgi:hypothetical protein